MAETHPATSLLVDAVRKNAGGLLKVTDQVAALAPGQGGELAFLSHIGVEGRVTLLEKWAMRVMVEDFTVNELLPIYRKGMENGRLGEEAHAAALTPELQGKLPLAAVRRWIDSGDWRTQTGEAATRLRAAILDLIMQQENDAEMRHALFDLVGDDLLADAKKDKLVGLIRAARAETTPMDEVLFGYFSSTEIASCAKSSWRFISITLESWEKEEQELGAEGGETNPSPPQPQASAS